MGSRDLDMGKEVRKRCGSRAIRLRANDHGVGKTHAHCDRPQEYLSDVITNTQPRQRHPFNGNPKMINEAKLVKRSVKAIWTPRAPLVIYITIAGKGDFAPHRRTARKNAWPAAATTTTLRALKNRRRYYKEQVSASGNILLKEHIRR